MYDSNCGRCSHALDDGCKVIECGLPNCTVPVVNLAQRGQDIIAKRDQDHEGMQPAMQVQRLTP